MCIHTNTHTHAVVCFSAVVIHLRFGTDVSVGILWSENCLPYSIVKTYIQIFFGEEFEFHPIIV